MNGIFIELYLSKFVKTIEICFFHTFFEKINELTLFNLTARLGVYVR